MLAARTVAPQIDPVKLAASIEEFLAARPAAVALEDGRVIFDFRTARYSIRSEHGRCVLQLWSEERNLIRTVVGVEQRAQTLRLLTRRMGAAKPQALEIALSGDRRTPTVRERTRRDFQRLLERVLARNFFGARIEGVSSAIDLEHSFGPAYVRGILLKGPAAEAFIAVSANESSAIIDGVLTLGILWLNYCRERGDGRRYFGGLKVFVPAGAQRTTAERMAWLNHDAAGFELYVLDERTEQLEPIDYRDSGNLESRLMRAFSRDAAIERCREGIDRVLALVPEMSRDRVELCPSSSAIVGLSLHGLEFARVRYGFAANSFAHEQEITFGAGANETPLTDENEQMLRDLLARLFQSRHADGSYTDALFRLQPERWLESEFRAHIAELLPSVRGDVMYSQVPALSISDRGLLDLLALDRNGRLIVIELKADEDLHLPLQALDYWIRVRALNADRQTSPEHAGRALSAFERHGYFSGAEIAALPPKLVLAAPALRIHPANETVLRYLSPEVDWEFIALGEHWRREINVVFRKHSAR